MNGMTRTILAGCVGVLVGMYISGGINVRYIDDGKNDVNVTVRGIDSSTDNEPPGFRDAERTPTNGWRIICNEQGRYTFVDPNGSTNCFTRGSKEEVEGQIRVIQMGELDNRKIDPSHHDWVVVE
jgi:hypothetical protein